MDGNAYRASWYSDDDHHVVDTPKLYLKYMDMENFTNTFSLSRDPGCHNSVIIHRKGHLEGSERLNV